MLNFSPTNIIANNRVTNGSANKNELVIAAHLLHYIEPNVIA